MRRCSLRYRQITSTTFGFGLLLVGFLFPQSFPQTANAKPIAPEWKDAQTRIAQALSDAGISCPKDLTGAGVVETAEVTGSKVPEALVEYCRIGAYTSDFVIMRFENGKPMVARFRDPSGRMLGREFLRGASVRNGEDVEFLPESHAVYGLHWHTDDSGALEACTVDAYVWSSKTNSFNQNDGIAKTTARRECAKLREQLGDLTGH